MRSSLPSLGRSADLSSVVDIAAPPSQMRLIVERGKSAMTREQFEAHVRAEAEEKHPIRAEMPLTHRLVDDAGQRAYIAARMEHEWPLVEALQLAINHLVDSATVTLEYIPPASAMRRSADAFEKREADIRAIQNALSPYTTKHIEQ